MTKISGGWHPLPYLKSDKRKFLFEPNTNINLSDTFHISGIFTPPLNSTLFNNETIWSKTNDKVHIKYWEKNITYNNIENLPQNVKGWAEKLTNDDLKNILRKLH